MALSGLLGLASLALFAGDAVSRPVGLESASRPASHIVMFEEDADVDQLVAELRSNYGVEVRFVYRHALKGASVVVDDRFLADMTAHPGVKLVETNGGVELTAFPEEQEVQDWMKRSGMDIGHPAVDLDGTGPDLDVDIAIIDSGVLGTHPDINLWAAIDCVFDGTGTVPALSENCTTYDDPTASIDDAGHGTRVAGIAAAKDNGFGIVGYAPGARIWSARLSGDDTIFGGANSSPDAFEESFLAAIDWVALHADEIEVVNMSLRLFETSSAVRTAIQAVVNSGVVFVAAAGNQAGDVYGPDEIFGTADDVEPAAYPEVATISGYVDTDGAPGGSGPNSSGGEADDTFYSGSNTSSNVVNPLLVTSPGAAIDFAMPAVDIWSSCYPDAAIEVSSQKAECLANSDGQGGNYGRISGTSFAAPQAAGLAALLISKLGTRDIDGDSDVDADDVYALRQMLIDLAVAQNNSAFGLVTPSGDPDGNPDPIGSAGMVLNFDVSTFTLADTGASQQVTVDTPYVPISETIQINLVHDSSKFTISNPQCGSAYSGGAPISPTANSDGNGTVIGCTRVGGPATDSGPVLTFDVVAANNGTQSFTLGTGTPVLNANSPGFDITFSADITGAFDLQAVSGEPALTLIDPSVTAIRQTGASQPNVAGQYDPATGNFTINVIEPGTFDVQADASGFISRLYSTVTVSSAGVVTGLPPSTTLNGGDVIDDDMVDGSDLAIVLGAFGSSTADRLNGTGQIVDINGDGVVNGVDISVLISNLFLAPPGGVEVWPAAP